MPNWESMLSTMRSHGLKVDDADWNVDAPPHADQMVGFQAFHLCFGRDPADQAGLTFPLKELQELPRYKAVWVNWVSESGFVNLPAEESQIVDLLDMGVKRVNRLAPRNAQGELKCVVKVFYVRMHHELGGVQGRLKAKLGIRIQRKVKKGEGWEDLSDEDLPQTLIDLCRESETAANLNPEYANRDVAIAWREAWLGAPYTQPN